MLRKGISKNTRVPGIALVVITTLILVPHARAQDGATIAPHAPATTPAATPVFSPAGGTYRTVKTVSITDSTAGASIYYTTDGTTPSKSSTLYSGSISVSTTTTLEAAAFATGFARSAVAHATYVIELPAATPSFSPSAGTYQGPQQIQINDATAGATVYYTTDGSSPSTSSSVYAGAISVNATETLKAIAQATGGSHSPVATAQYTIVLTSATAPTFSPAAGNYNAEQFVSIHDTTAGAVIYYTTDGTTPTATSATYAMPIPVSRSETVKAIGVARGYQTSAPSSATYAITPPGVTESVLYSFGASPDGSTPLSALVQGIDGNLYGTTYQGGANGLGSVYSITPAGVETVLYSFQGTGQGTADGKLPFTTLLQGTDGNFYGTTEWGGTYGAGTVFQLTPAGMERVIYSFGASANGIPDGTFPEAALIQGNDGNFYGTTASGGSAQSGTVFKITSAGQESILYSFGANGGSDGMSPRAALLLGNDGNFYGTTVQGGADDAGTVFSMTPGGAESVLHSFGNGGNVIDGAVPEAALIQGKDGNFYGTTVYGGANDQGTVYEVTPAGSESLLYSFGANGSADGAYPVAGLIQANDGNFYGTTTQGNSTGMGTVFEVTSGGQETIIHFFIAGNGGTDGADPYAALIQTAGGTFYGTTQDGGSGAGAIFQITTGISNDIRK